MMRQRKYAVRKIVPIADGLILKKTMTKGRHHLGRVPSDITGTFIAAS